MAAARASRRAVLVALALAVAAAAGLGLWWALGRDDPDRDCAGLRTDDRIRQVLGAAWRSDLPCTALGDELRRATTGERPGVHSLAQARAMRAVVLALADGRDHHVHPDLRRPLAEALADYAADTHAVLALVDDTYNAHSERQSDAWEDGQGVHFSVQPRELVRAVRGLSDDPTAYALLRAADLRRSAAGFAAVEAPPSDAALEDVVRRAAAPAGAYDAVADDVLRERGADSQRPWRSAALDRFRADGPDPAPAYSADPAGHLTAACLARTDPNDASGFVQLQGQTVCLLNQWSAASRSNLGPPELGVLGDRALNTTHTGRQEAQKALAP
ncbi:hypothetical protein ACGF07_28865 [Kitasatospora sp. NPDC048194]|uniref:hypothetical protein n=1 Tax=Kitasatospora sp. NPDC048194 TaxID=3364045 RepID=UPI00371CC547